MNRCCYAVDVGGTKIKTAVIDTDGRILALDERPSQASQGGARVLANMAAGIDALTSQLPAGGGAPVAIGISAAGVIDPASGRVLDATDAIPGWKGSDLRAYFSQRYQLPVLADNDVNCALLGELWRGALADQPVATAIMLTLGTGLGGAVVQHGRLWSGRHGLAGHVGRNLMQSPLVQGWIPVEQHVSGSGLFNLYLLLGGDPAKAPDQGRGVVALAQAGDDLAARALQHWVDALAVQLHNLYWTYDPDVVLLGGGVIASCPYWWTPLQQRLVELQVALPLLPATLGNDAGVFGAARLVWDKEAGDA